MESKSPSQRRADSIALALARTINDELVVIMNGDERDVGEAAERLRRAAGVVLAYASRTGLRAPKKGLAALVEEI